MCDSSALLDRLPTIHRDRRVNYFELRKGETQFSTPQEDKHYICLHCQINCGEEMTDY